MTKILCISYVGMNYIRKSNGICNALMEKFHFDPIFCAPHLVSHSDKHRVMYLRRMNKLTCMTSSQHRESPDILVPKTLSRYKNLKPDEEKFLWCFSASHHFFSFPQKDRLAECLQRLLDEFSYCEVTGVIIGLR